MRTYALALAILLPVVAAGDDVRTLVAQLGAEDATARDAAQRGLEKLGKAPLGELKSALTAATDPEVRSRLATLVEAIEEETASFDAIPPDHVADLAPLIHAFHAECGAHGNETGVCRRQFDSLGAFLPHGRTAVAVLRTILAKLNACLDDRFRVADDASPEAWTPNLLGALIPAATGADVPGLDEMGPLYTELLAGAERTSFDRRWIREALSKQKSLGATTALLAWVRTTREPMRAGLTGGCTGTAAPFYNDLMSVERALEENADKRLVLALIDLLDADDVSQSFGHIEGPFTVPSPTHVAIDVLRKLTAQEFPYDGMEASRDKRAEAIDRVKAWCKDHAAK